MNKCVVITGADGFIGRHLCHVFSARGYSIVAFVIPNSPIRSSIDSIPNVRVIETDLSNLLNHVEAVQQEPLAVIHLAWAGVAAQLRNNLSLQMENIKLGVYAVEFAAAVAAQKFVMPGSTMEYLYSGKDINGWDVPTPRNAYGAAKVAARYICQEKASQLHIPFIYAILSSTYSADRRDGNVIYYVIESLLKKQKPLLTKLEQRWDYIYIADLVEALALICEKGVGSKCYAVGRGDNIPLRDYIEQIHELIDPSSPLGIGEIPYKDDRLPQSCVDISELQKDTGFVPKVDFKSGIAKVICSVQKEVTNC